MPIPLYDQQIGVPKPPRLRKQVSAEAGRAAAIGQFGQQIAQAVSGFAGRLADLAAQNEINEALVNARDQWQDFQTKIQDDPEYTTYGDKLKEFYDGLYEDLYGKMKLPRSKMALKQRLEELRLNWEDQVQRYSDSRARDHARALRQQSLSQRIRDLDIEGVLTELQEAREALEFDEQDLLKFQETAISQIVKDKTMAYARGLGNAGVSWLLSEKAGEKFAYQVGDSVYNLDPDTLKSMAAALNAEQNLLKAQNMAATEERREKQYRELRLGIESGEITSVYDIWDESKAPDLTISQRNTLETELDIKLKEAENKILVQKQDTINDVKAAIDMQDFEYAQSTLSNDIASGYVDGNDEDIKRLQYLLDRMSQPVRDIEGEKEVSKTRIELMLLSKTSRDEIEREILGHAQKYAKFEDTSDFVSHIREQLDQADREAEEKRERDKAYWAATHTGPEYIQYFTEKYADAETIEDLNELLKWLRENTLPTEQDPYTSRIGTDKKQNWENMIEAKRNKFQTPEYQKRQDTVKRGEEKIQQWFAKEIEDAGKEYKQELLTQLDKMLREYEARVDEVEDPAALADYLLNPPKREKVKRVLQNIPRYYETVWESDVEYFTRIGIPELASRFKPRPGTTPEYAAAVAPKTPSYLEARRQRALASEWERKPVDWSVYHTRADGSIEIYRVIQEGKEVILAYNTETGEWEPVDPDLLREYEAQQPG